MATAGDDAHGSTPAEAEPPSLFRASPPIRQLRSAPSAATPPSANTCFDTALDESESKSGPVRLSDFPGASLELPSHDPADTSSHQKRVRGFLSRTTPTPTRRRGHSRPHSTSHRPPLPGQHSDAGPLSATPFGAEQSALPHGASADVSRCNSDLTDRQAIGKVVSPSLARLAGGIANHLPLAQGRKKQHLASALPHSRQHPRQHHDGLIPYFVPGRKAHSTPVHTHVPHDELDTDETSFGRRQGNANHGNMFGLGKLQIALANVGSHASPEDDEAAGGKKIAPALFTFTPMQPQVPTTSEDDAPAGDQPFQQAGGHQGVFRADGPVLEKSVGDREKEFYENAFKHNAWPKQFLPKYYGEIEGSDGRIGLENLTYGMKSPCVLDLKLGTSSVEEDESSFLKRMKMNALDVLTRTKAAGVRLEGLSMYRTLEHAKIKTSKAQSHAISASIGVTLQDVLTFFLTDESGVRTDVALRFQSHIESILYHFESSNDKFLFIGSSILFVYDNDNTSPHLRWARAIRRATSLGSDDVAGLTRRTQVAVRMIDFAHTGPLPVATSRDEGYITGLHSILDALRAIRSTRAQPIFSLANAARDAMDQASTGALSTQDSQAGSSQLVFATGNGQAQSADFNFSMLFQEMEANAAEADALYATAEGDAQT